MYFFHAEMKLHAKFQVSSTFTSTISRNGDFELKDDTCEIMNILYFSHSDDFLINKTRISSFSCENR